MPLEFAGQVVAIGQGVDESLLGATVVATTAGRVGGYAERAVAPAMYTFPVPEGLALDVALTVFQAGAVAIGLRAFDRHFLFGPEIFGSTLVSDPFKAATSPGEVLLGAHYTWSDWRLGGGIGTGLSDAFTSTTSPVTGE